MGVKKDPEKFAQPKVKRTFFGVEIPHRFVFYDKLQRGSVFVLVSATVIIMTRFFVDVGHYYAYRKPLLREKGRILKELEMRSMQAEREAASKEDQLQEQLQAEADKIQ